MRECEDCKYCKVIPMVVRGVMDADPTEYYCDKDNEVFVNGYDCDEFEWRV